MPSTVDILVRLRTATANGLMDIHSALRGLEHDASAGERALKNLRGGLIGLAPAAIPVAASLAASLGPLAAQLGAAGVEAGAFAVALGPQATQMTDAAKAQQKLTDSISKYGANSQQARQAQQDYLDQLSSMPPATQKAAVALQQLNETYKGWSNSLAGDTMPVAIKGFGILEGVFPKLTLLVRDSSTQFQRLEDVLGGSLSTPGFDRLTGKFDAFAHQSLKGLVDELLHFSRIVSEGDFAHGPMSEFLDYARKEGPEVRATLVHLEEALAHIGQAAAQAGPGMLEVVNALAQFADAVPTPVLTRLIQLYTALKLLKGTAAGVQVVSGSLGNLTRTLGSMTNAATNAGGGLAGVRAAVGTLSTGTKIAAGVAAIAGLALVLKHFSDESKQAKISASDMATSLKGIAAGDGGATSKAIEQLNKDVRNLHQSFTERLDSNDSVWDIITNSGSKTTSAKKDLRELGQSLADMVKAGDASQAAAALERLNKAGVQVPTKYLKDYKSALADVKFEQDLTADSMGLFGQQAMSVQKKLDQQKNAVQGLQQAILDLNDANRAGLDAEADYQQAIDDATKLVKDHRNALKMVNGELNLNGQSARDAYLAMSKLASSTEANAKATLQQTGSQAKANEKLIEGHDQLVKLGEAMGLKSKDAKKLADALDNIKDPKIQITVQEDKAKAIIADAQKRLAAMPSKKTLALRGEASQLYDVMRDAQAKINAMHGKNIIIRATTYYDSKGNPHQSFHEGGHYAHGGVVGAASGGPRSNLTLVGEQGPELVRLAAGSTVISNPETRRMLSGASGGAVPPINITVELDGAVIARKLLDPQRELVRQLGGDVQNVYGRRS
jgi:trimeric autotransporter adhesin